MIIFARELIETRSGEKKTQNPFYRYYFSANAHHTVHIGKRSRAHTNKHRFTYIRQEYHDDTRRLRRALFFRKTLL